MKLSLICIPFLLLTSCSLFEKTPSVVLGGQRAVYQSVMMGEEASMNVIDVYVSDSKKAVTYHLNYIFQLDISSVDSSVWEKEYKQRRKLEIEKKRDEKLKKAYDNIDRRANSMRSVIKKRHKATLRLVGSVYNYLSTNPIEIDNMEFWIKKLDKLAEKAKAR